MGEWNEVLEKYIYDDMKCVHIIETFSHESNIFRKGSFTVRPIGCLNCSGFLLCVCIFQLRYLISFFYY